MFQLCKAVVYFHSVSFSDQYWNTETPHYYTGTTTPARAKIKSNVTEFEIDFLQPALEILFGVHKTLLLAPYYLAPRGDTQSHSEGETLDEGDWALLGYACRRRVE